MLNEETETERLNRIVADGARAFAAEELRWVRAFAERHKPDGYTDHQRGLRLRFEGSGADFVDAALKARFKKSHEDIPRRSLNWVKHVAVADAGVYRLQPERKLVVNGADAKDEKQRAFDDTLERARVGLILPEVERRANASLTHLVHVRWSPTGKRIVLDPYWPADVGVIGHPSEPSNLDTALLLIARTAHGAADDDEEWFTLWVRGHEDGPDGKPASFGPWRVHLVSSEGEYLLPPDDARTLYVDRAGAPLPLPWCVVQLGLPTSSIFIDEDRDLVGELDSLNVSASSEAYAVDMQAHTPVVYTGAELKKNEVAWGPGELTKIGAGETLQTLTLDPKLEALRESRKLALKELGITRRNPDGYVVRDGTQIASGVALLVAGEAHQSVLDERAQSFRVFETEQLLPRIVETHDAFSDNPPLGPCTFRVTMRKPAPFEDPEAKQRRLQADVDAGLISPAWMAVELGYYPTVEAAKGKGVSDELKKKASPPPMFGFGAPAAPDPLADPAKPADPATTEATPADQVKP